MAEPNRKTHGLRCARGSAGQAQLELLAALPALIAAGLILLQLMSVGYSQSLADGSAEAGAIALTAGASAQDAARGALPGWAASRVEVTVADGRVAVELQPPELLPGLGERFEVSSSAWARPPEGSV